MKYQVSFIPVILLDENKNASSGEASQRRNNLSKSLRSLQHGLQSRKDNPQSEILIEIQPSRKKCYLDLYFWKKKIKNPTP